MDFYTKRGIFSRRPGRLRVVCPAREAKHPLDGIRVLDLSGLAVGNVLSATLADFGAEVIKVEQLHGSDGRRAWTENGNRVPWKGCGRNKKSPALDVRKGEGRRIIETMVMSAQVLVESLGPGGLEQLGLGPEPLLAINPSLVIVRLGNASPTGPYCQDQAIDADAGRLSRLAANDHTAPDPAVTAPARTPDALLAESVVGADAAFAVMLALREVEVKGGRGQVIDLSRLEPLMPVAGPPVSTDRAAPDQFVIDRAAPDRVGRGRTHDGGRGRPGAPPRAYAPQRGVYRAMDGVCVAICASTEDMKRRLFRAIGREDLIDVEGPGGRAELDRVVQAFVERLCSEAVLDFFERFAVNATRVRSAAPGVADPDVIARELRLDRPDDDVDRMAMRNVVHFPSTTPGANRRRAPRFDDHADDILAALGLDEETLRRLCGDGVL